MFGGDLCAAPLRMPEGSLGIPLSRSERVEMSRYLWSESVEKRPEYPFFHLFLRYVSPRLIFTIQSRD